MRAVFRIRSNVGRFEHWEGLLAGYGTSSLIRIGYNSSEPRLAETGLYKMFRSISLKWLGNCECSVTSDSSTIAVHLQSRLHSLPQLASNGIR